MTKFTDFLYGDEYHDFQTVVGMDRVMLRKLAWQLMPACGMTSSKIWLVFKQLMFIYCFISEDLVQAFNHSRF